MPSPRKRRSNRLTVTQLAERKDVRDRLQNQPVVLLRFGQEHMELEASLYRSVSLGVAQRMVRDGEAQQFSAPTANGDVVIFRELVPVKGMQYQLPTIPNAASAEALAGYTPGARLCGRERARAEHAIVYPFIGDTKAPLVMPRVSERDRITAAQLLGNRPATAGHCYRKAA